MQLYQKEKTFLYYFLPLFATKLLNITADNIILQLVAVCCFLVFLTYFVRIRVPSNIFQIYIVLGLYSTMLVFTCGKQGALFSVLTVILMRGIDLSRIVYKKCLGVGVIFVLLSCYLEKEGGGVMLRYINGEWTEIVKRSNILFISYLAVMFLYILQKKDFLKWKVIIPFIICSYIMSIYTGSRTGMVIVVLFFLVAFALQFNLFRRTIVKYLCIATPLICLGLSYFVASNYGKYEYLDILDMMTQGRVAQGYMFLNRYGLSIIGQHIEENFGSDGGDFACLDSAYMDMLICEGVIFTIFWIVVSMKVIKYMWDQNRMIEVAILVTYAVYGMTETFLINCFLNISIFFYGEFLYAKYDKSLDNYN